MIELFTLSLIVAKDCSIADMIWKKPERELAGSHNF